MADKKLEQFNSITDPSTINTAVDFLIGNDVNLSPELRDTKYTFDVLKRLFDSTSNQVVGDLSGATSLVIDPLANDVYLRLIGNWNPLNVTGFISGKIVRLIIGTNGVNGFPWQIVFPSGIKLDDGIGLLLKNNVVDATFENNFDIIVLRGIADGKAIVENVIYG